MAEPLSVCCLTGGHSAARTAAILRLYRPLAREIVVAVDERNELALPQLAAVSDRLLRYPFQEPGDRPIAWLFSACREPWLLNVDDDEVPSPALLAALPEVLSRRDLSHAWIARRWLYPDVTTYLDEPPWGREYQLRLVRPDGDLVGFSDEFHRPVVARGPAMFLEQPLWHLDTAVNSFGSRRRKALRYERQRRGMRAASLSHNSGFYLPELRPDARTRPVPANDLAVIRAVLEPRGGPPAGKSATASVERATRLEIDRRWPGSPWPETLYAARLELLEAPPSLVSGVQQTVDARVANLGDVTWPWGSEGVPQVRLSYRWRRDGEVLEHRALRTPLPCDLPPGGSLVVPLHVLPPAEPGRYTLEVDLVHEHVRWFGRPACLEVDVRRRRRVAVAGAEKGVEDALDRLFELPELEPVLLGPGSPVVQRFGHHQLPGLRPFLVGEAAAVSPVVALARAVRVLRAARARRPPASLPEPVRELLAGLAGCEAVIVAGPDWGSGAPQSRELLRVATTLAAARALGARVLLVGDPAPTSAGAGDRALSAAVRSLGEDVAPERLPEALRSTSNGSTRRPR